jgi:hypothetical protein
MTSMIRVAAVLGLVAMSKVASAQLPATDSTGVIVGVVAIKDADVVLPYSVVSIPALAREQFTDDRGAFRLAGLPVGRLRLRVRHVGYSPVELDVAVRGGASDTVHVALTRIAVRLTAMQVKAYPQCVTPGPPSTRDTAFTAIFGQLKQNAEQFRLLSTEYPFLYGVQRTISTLFGTSDLRRDGVDTITLSSAAQWDYRPGTVVEREKRLLRPDGPVTMRIPSLANFADSVFIANHCFYNGGLETIDGTTLVRVDFIAAAALKEPDVDGAMFLDPASFQIRRSLLRLSKPPRAVPDIVATEATTIFSELFPSVPVIATVTSVNYLNPRRGRRAATQTREDQQLIAVAFTGRKPGEDAKKP